MSESTRSKIAAILSAYPNKGHLEKSHRENLKKKTTAKTDL